MPTQTWKVVVTKLGGAEVLGEVEIVASNWMGALRAGRERLGEPPSLPAGASCTVDDDGVATVLDPAARRKLVLAPLGVIVGPTDPPPSQGHAAHAQASAPVAPQQHVAEVAAPVATPAVAPAPATQDAAPPAETAKKRKRFETVAFMPGQLPVRPPVAVGTPAAESAPEVAAPQEPPPAAIPATAGAQALAPSVEARAASPAREPSSPVPARSLTPSGLRSASVSLEVIFERNEDPSATNPLCYRERAYLMPRGMSVAETEAALRFELAGMQAALVDRPRGKLVNLAAFDHRWSDAPERAPIVALQWRDWRDEVNVDYPAVRLSSLPPAPLASDAPPAHDDRLDDVFQGLADLSRLSTPVEGLDLAVRLLAQTVPSEASAACLYDIDSDELRFVSVAGAGAAPRQGRAVRCSSGLTGQALRDETRPTVFRDLLLQPAFVPDVDAPAELDARNLLVCPVAYEGHLLGAIQLVNRVDAAAFSRADTHVVGYVAERLGEFLRVTRQKLDSASQPAGRR